MMDKKPHIKPYLYGMLAGFGAISPKHPLLSFLIYRFDGFRRRVSTLTGILMPFIYGAVIAYLLKPVCNTIEGFLRRSSPKSSTAWPMCCACGDASCSVCCWSTPSCMMVVPQLITSVTSLYYTAQTSITRVHAVGEHI